MPFDEKLNSRIREALADLPEVEGKKMFNGACYMLNGKMCISVVKDEMMCRIDPEKYEAVLEKDGCREMIHKGKPLKGYVLVSNEGIKTKRDFDYWINLSLEFNKKAKSSMKKKK